MTHTRPRRERLMHALDHIASLTWSSLSELLPWFFLAVVIGAAVDILCLDIPARRSFKRHGLLGILFTTSLGALSPFCSFTVIPLIRRLLRSGIPLSAVMAFWIASPAMDPPIYGLTAAQIGVRLATARLIGALMLSIAAGLFVLALERRGMLRNVLRDEPKAGDRRAARHRDLRALPKAVTQRVGAIPAQMVAYARSSSSATPAVAPPVAAYAATTVTLADPAATHRNLPAQQTFEQSSSTCNTATDEHRQDDDGPWWPAAKASLSSGRNWRITGRNIIRDSISLGKWLLFACLFQALIRLYVPTHVVTAILGHSGLLAIPLAVMISVPLYLNAVGAVPIVGALLAKGMVPGAAVSFLLGGAVTTIPAMVAVRSVVNNRVFAIYLGMGLLGSTVIGLAAQLIL